ncbi:polyamine ABC transporter substrate-binding protein [Haematospirillum jordaniae]|uniref:Putrescine-binding periplasmic protein n=1 Tax=Haematospirillum jordaniae TaxID=1549855 RepID=A0A143DFE5_9PROT|nr:polyamine ABC transporter substrate-binding protein [Haematospirillum jordaniae]AMW35474.1 spermidine/putrescine ABC transporter substrate-binding protein [Haematospirillum jordaniae]NKD45301.1 polyamine ABC transporter substrate-binding protein [Haematospirillum jordaniae]NKD57293.1 polyamine ABC transporter substrate-binding protein [Haematospirillum jordaniae]NKD59647.1 polyamine ABC transporter substrate-binding protein [Haematospirillum jordaniae]NKD67219.1 polyamine ABC transporter su
MSRFRIALSGLLAPALALMTVVTPVKAEEEKKLNLFIWSDYLGEDTIQSFEKETGIKVTVDVYDSNEMLEAKLLAGKSGYDLAVPTGAFFQRQIKAGVYQPLKQDLIPNLGNLDQKLMKGAQEFDANNTHGIIYMWGTNGMAYNPAKVAEVAGPDAPVDSWALMFDPVWAEKVSKCGLYMMDSPSEVFPSALKYLGLDPNSSDPKDIEKAEALLMKVRPFVTKFHSSESINALANGDICVAMGFSGDMFQAINRAEEAGKGVKVTYVIPKEGSEIWFDFMGVMKDAPHPDNAMKFINHILKPEITAGISNTVFYANANTKSFDLIHDAIRHDPGVYPPESVMKHLFVKKVPDQKAERVFTRIWNRIKTGI